MIPYSLLQLFSYKFMSVLCQYKGGRSVLCLMFELSKLSLINTNINQVMKVK